MCSHDTQSTHILCLPFEVRLYVLGLIHEYRLEIYSKISDYRDILERRGVLELVRERREHLRKSALLIHKCNELIRPHLDRLIQKKMALVLLAEPRGTSDFMTRSGKHVLVVIDKKYSEHILLRSLPIDIEEQLLKSPRGIQVSCYAAALFAKFRTNPFEGNDYIEIDLQTLGKRKIWWVSNRELDANHGGASQHSSCQVRSRRSATTALRISS